MCSVEEEKEAIKGERKAGETYVCMKGLEPREVDQCNNETAVDYYNVKRENHLPPASSAIPPISPHNRRPGTSMSKMSRTHLVLPFSPLCCWESLPVERTGLPSAHGYKPAFRSRSLQTSALTCCCDECVRDRINLPDSVRGLFFQ